MSEEKEQLAITAWLNVIIEYAPSRQEIASKYNHKRVTLHTQGSEGYYQIHVPKLAQSETIAAQTPAPGREAEAQPAQPQAQPGSPEDEELARLMQMSLPQRLSILSHTISIYSPATQNSKLDWVI